MCSCRQFLPVKTLSSLEFVAQDLHQIAAERGQFTLGQHHNPVSHVQYLVRMADQKHRRPVVEGLQHPQQMGHGVGVEVVGRLIKDQQTRSAQQGAGEGDPLPLTAGQKGRLRR